MATVEKIDFTPEERAEYNKLLEKLGTRLSFEEFSEVVSALERLRINAKERKRLAKKEEEKRKKEEERLKKEEAERENNKNNESLQKAATPHDLYVESITSMDLPLDWENVFNDDPRTQGVHTESIPDALILSLSNLARVDIEYISSITGADYKTVICALKGSIYQNPETWNECFFKGWETAEEYLSGNLLRKLRIAREANTSYNGYFSDNVRAIKRILPKTVAAKDIYVTLGSPWVPTDVIDQFIAHIFKLRGAYIGTLHDELTGSWEIYNKSLYQRRNSVAATSTYGTPRIGALDILERTLNMKTVSVTDEIDCPNTASGKKRVINQAETVLALEKQQKIIAEFQKWVWRDTKRKEQLETIFEDKFSCVRRRIFDGSFLQFPTMSRNIELFPYQKNAVARILFSANTLLAHDVGSGKTYIMIAAGMELRRMGLSKKNLYVVPNNIVGQWAGIFKEMYPDSSVLCVEPKDFTKDKKNKTLEKIRDNDYDGIIMAYSCYDRIMLSKQFYINELEEARDALKRAERQYKKGTSNLKKKRAAIEKELVEITLKMQALDDMIYFDELGITRLFVDEAHNYKNVPVETKTDRVLGISSGGSKKCKDMMDKVHHIQKTNNGGGVVMATGTPITNSLTDAFVMQKYLQSGELALLDLQSFDSWIGMFAERVTEFEIDVDTNSYRLATRFAKFHNLPELTALLSSIADFHQVDKSAGVPDFSGYNDALIGKTQDFSKYLEEISERADRVRNGYVDRKEDNMLKITTDGRKAALDVRLVMPQSNFTYQSKVARCAEKVYEIYRATAPQRSVQLIFCDSSTPKAGFNMYDEMKRILVPMGVLESEIAFIHDADTEKQREKLFAKARSGEIRVLLGSTFKLGLGVNVQDKLIALHHLDIPWRPADMTQREGRILRQGNQNETIYIYRYITEGSFDAYSWQLLETKQRFISGLLAGSLTERSGSDIEDTVLDYAEIKALAVGNPLVKLRVETANELSRYYTLQRKAIENHIRLEKEKMELPARISHQLELIDKCKADIEVYKNNSREYDKAERKALREEIFSALKENVLMTSERELMTYQGFTIVLPINMTMEKPFIWLKANGKYYVELADTELGVLVRIDNYLQRLQEHFEKLNSTLADMYARQNAIKNELLHKENYTDKIEECTKILEKIDKDLGVNKK